MTLDEQIADYIKKHGVTKIKEGVEGDPKPLRRGRTLWWLIQKRKAELGSGCRNRKPPA